MKRGQTNKIFIEFKKTNKKGDFSFVWLFAIIAGIAILLLAIYGATKVGSSMKIQTEAEIAKQITIITDPLESGFAQASKAPIEFGQEIDILFACSHYPGDFGENRISTKIHSTDLEFDKTKFIVAARISDKYIFGKEFQTAKTFYTYSMSFDFPFKVADYLLFFSENDLYCIKNSPRKFNEELDSMDLPVITFDNCSKDEGFQTVCFGEDNCDITIEGTCEGSGCRDIYDTGIVTKNGKTLLYVGDLIYPAIFSDKKIYDCNVNRLLYKASIVSLILSKKASLMNARGCTTNLEPILNLWSNELSNASISDMVNLYPDAVNMENQYRWEVCSAW
jgi:hypothetical protein